MTFSSLGLNRRFPGRNIPTIPGIIRPSLRFSLIAERRLEARKVGKALVPSPPFPRLNPPFSEKSAKKFKKRFAILKRRIILSPASKIPDAEKALWKQNSAMRHAGLTPSGVKSVNDIKKYLKYSRT
jgi:hypothetical protein